MNQTLQRASLRFLASFDFVNIKALNACFIASGMQNVRHLVYYIHETVKTFRLHFKLETTLTGTGFASLRGVQNLYSFDWCDICGGQVAPIPTW